MARVYHGTPKRVGNHWRIVPHSDKRTFRGGLPFAVFKGWAFLALMPYHLKRIIGRGDLHFITFCCYQRRPLLGSARTRNLAVKILQQVRARYRFALVGFVFMPEHVHLLLSESGSASPARIIQVFKQRLSRHLRAKKPRCKGQLALRFPGEEPLRRFWLRRFWQRRYYDFNVYSRAKAQEKLHYMHDNPVREKLVPHPGDWPWSSWCFYFRGAGLLQMDPWF